MTVNPHLSTAILYRTHSPDVTFTEDVSFIEGTEHTAEHMGLSMIEMMVQNEPFPSVHLLAAYIPNRSATNTVEYTTSLANAIISAINNGTSQGCPVILALDANCPFAQKAVFPPSANSPVLRRILNEAGVPSGRRLVVMNWVADTQGFFTRTRAGQASHQLDLFVVTDDIANRCTMSISPEINFDSDHCIIQLYMRSYTPEKAQESSTTVKKYIWSEQGKIDYRGALEAPLQVYAKQSLNILSYNDSEKQKPNHESVDKAVRSLVTIILSACDKALEFTNKTTTKRAPRAPAQDGHVAAAIKYRESARLTHSTAVSSGASREAQATAAAAYAEARTRVLSTFAQATHEKHKKIWAKMKEAWQDDVPAFFKEFTALTSPARQPLPRSLRVNGEEMRKPGNIRKAWMQRFNLPDEETGGTEDKQFREDTELENVERMHKQTHESATYNRRYRLGEIQEAVGKSKIGKKTGSDMIQNEMLKWGGTTLHMCMTHLFNIMHEAERVAKPWKTTPQAPMYKRGDVGELGNYRPISYMSNLYKNYERCIDKRIRGTVLIPDAQCGFRKGYGPLVTLTRAKIVLEYCKTQGIDLYLTFIDFKQAFERVWRGGLLARLWEMGVRGKLWRVIKDMLTGTKSFVQTNFGDTEKWKVEMGIIQGSVLSAILFIIFISPMATDLTHLSPTINGVVIPPQLFADDGTLYAVGNSACIAIINGCMTWVAKWKMVLNMKKSKALALNEYAEKLYKDKEKFELVKNMVALGVGVDSRGVYSTAYLRTLLARLVTKVRTIMHAGVRLGALRPDMGLHLYASLAQSIVKYALPLTAHTSSQVRRLEEQQERFALNYLSLPQSTPPHAAKAELGLIDYDLSSRMSRVLLHHRIHTSNDAFTRQLADWNLGNGSTVGDCTEVLQSLLPAATWAYFTNLPYRAAKVALKESAMVLQGKRWATLETELGHRTAHAGKSKPQWGMEKSLHGRPPMAVITYIRVRNGAGINGDHIRDGMCAGCGLHPQSEVHMLWTCTSTREARESFRREATSAAPTAWRGLASLDPQKAFHYLMGAGVIGSPSPEWEKFQRAAVEFVMKVFGAQSEG